MLNAAKWFLALLAILIMWKLAYQDGVRTGELSLNYWSGWQDAMIATDYGRQPYDNSQQPLQ